MNAKRHDERAKGNDEHLIYIYVDIPFNIIYPMAFHIQFNTFIENICSVLHLDSMF